MILEEIQERQERLKVNEAENKKMDYIRATMIVGAYALIKMATNMVKIKDFINKMMGERRARGNMAIMGAQQQYRANPIPLV